MFNRQDSVRWKYEKSFGPYPSQWMTAASRDRSGRQPGTPHERLHSSTQAPEADSLEVPDGSVAGPWAGLGQSQLKWLESDLRSVKKNTPIVLFTHNPLYEYYPPWNFWVRDWREVHEIVRPYSNVTNIHGHSHQVLYLSLIHI